MPRPRGPAEGPGPVPAIVADRFRVQRVMQRGTGSATVVAHDEQTGAAVVLKTARADALSRGTRLRLLHEADVLRSLSGPGLVPLVDAGEDDGLFYLAMPLLPGRTLAERLRGGRLSVAETLHLAEDLFAALALVHDRDVLHRDIKPSNIMVGEDEVAGATLIDFGLARSVQLDASVRDEPVGTARYMSPEQAGLVHREVDERSDLYAAGVVLFECLTGRPPFEGRSVGEVLRQHLSAPPPDLRSYVEQVPAALAQIVQRLLRKDPRDRYQSADGVLADIRELAAALAAGETDPSISLGMHDRRSTITEPAFVGRRSELASLLDAVRLAGSGEGGVVLLEAESGGGKSRLLDELAVRCVAGETVVLRGQGVDQAARRPFQLLEGVADGLVVAAERDPHLAERLRHDLAAEVGVLISVLPALQPLLGDVPTDELLGPEEFGEARALASLVHLLDALGSGDRVVVVLLDDCQWADEATVRLLGRWQRDHANSDDDRRLLLVAAYRSEEVRRGDPLRAASNRRLSLSPFTNQDVRSLVDSMAGQVPDAALDVIQRLSAGSPFMASAVLRGLVESGALFHDGRIWRTDDDLMAGAQSSREAATFLSQRLELLDPAILDLVGAGAVLGKEFDIDLAAGLVGVEPVDAVLALHGLRARHLLWLDPDAGVATFVHDKLREALLARHSDADRASLHARAATLLTEREDASSYDLAYHFHAAGDDAAALPYALAAAAEARARHALGAAEQQFRIAVAGVNADDRETMRVVRAGLGEVLMLGGRYDEAAECFTAALEVADASSDQAEINLRLGELTFKRGEVPASVGHLEGALRSLGRFVPRRRSTFLLLAVWELIVQAMHCLLPPVVYRRRKLADGATDILAARICSRLAYSYWFSAGRVPTLWAHIREMNILERYPRTLELAQAYSEHAPVMSTLPWYGRGIAYAKKSLEIRRDFGDVWGQGQSLHFYGVVLYAASRFNDAIDKLTEAIRLLDRTGDQWEINTATWHVGYCHYRLGEPEAALEAFRRCYASGVEIGDHQAAAISLAGLAKVTGGRVGADDIARELTHSQGDVHTAAELLTAEAVRLLSAGDPEGAIAALVDACGRIRAQGVRSEYVAPVLPWLVTALRMCAEQVGPYRLTERRALLRRAERVARKARRLAHSYRNNLPHALREQAALATLSGRERRARRLIARAATVADALRMARELELVHELSDAREDGRPPAGPVARELTRSVPVGGAATVGGSTAPSLSLVDRFDTLLRVGRQIAGALTPTDVYDVVRVAATELLRSEECHIVLVDMSDPAEERLVPLDESSGLGLSRQLVERAMRDRAVTVHEPDLDDDPADSLVLQQAKSALAAPIFMRGRPVACWMVVHRQLTGLFGADEERLAEFVSTLAGAALENAEGFAEVQALTLSLERRVEERTVELSVANNALRSTLEELERANNELRRLDELKSDFVAMVSHELRSPLTSILGYCATMIRHWDRVDDERKKSFIDIIDRQSRRLSGLVNDLLEMSRIESGKLDTKLLPIPLRPLLEELAGDFRERLPSLRLVGDVDSNVVADIEHLRRVLINLLDNAIKYGAPPVSVHVVREAGAVSIAVRDSGVGVDEEFRDRLFEKFAQASAGSTRKATGTGLGLSIVKGLVEAMEGSVRYEHSADRGGSFIVTLPPAY
ncbi:MAG: protein kinase [Frankiales bacterium]|nr:protein kinase [Frankiales bacterium]